MKLFKNQFVYGVFTGFVATLCISSIQHLSKYSQEAAKFIQPMSPHLAIKPVGLQQDEHCICNKPHHGAQQPKLPEPVNDVPVVKGILPISAINRQEDDTSMVDYLFEKVRVLCWVMTSPDNLQKKAIHVYNTWAHKCNKIIFVSSQEEKNFPAPVIKVETEEGRQHLTAKTMHAFKYMYDNHLVDADWFMKVDDDTFAIMENLRYFLSDKNPTDPVYYGHHFKTIVKPQGYHSGGGGYVLSKEALTRFVQKGFHETSVCREDGGAEDAEFGKCMQNLGVHIQDTYDEKGASRFHCLNPEHHLHGVYPPWYKDYDSHGAKSGLHTISDYAITFHYVNPNAMYSLAWYTYHLKVYGATFKNQVKLNDYYLQGEK